MTNDKMTITQIPIGRITLPDLESTMPLSVADLLRCGWRGKGLRSTPNGLVLAETRPSADHLGYVHYEVWNVGTREAWSSKRPTTPEFAGVALDEMLRPLGLDCASLRWSESGAAPHVAAIQRPEVSIPARGEFVYFLAAGAFLKIGKTIGAPDARIRTLQTGCPYAIRLVAYMAGGLKEERNLHKRFASLRASGEWFKHEGELAAFVRSLSEGATA